MKNENEKLRKHFKSAKKIGKKLLESAVGELEVKCSFKHGVDCMRLAK